VSGYGEHTNTKPFKGREFARSSKAKHWKEDFRKGFEQRYSLRAVIAKDK